MVNFLGRHLRFLNKALSRDSLARLVEVTQELSHIVRDLQVCQSCGTAVQQLNDIIGTLEEMIPPAEKQMESK